MNNKIQEFHEWLLGQRYIYFLPNKKGSVIYGSLEDKFPYDEGKKQHELSRNYMIEKTVRKMKDMGLIDDNINKEYLGIYDIPYVECHYYKIMAKDYDEALNKFGDRLVKDKIIFQMHPLEEDNIKIAPLFAIEVIE